MLYKINITQTVHLSGPNKLQYFGENVPKSDDFCFLSATTINSALLGCCHYRACLWMVLLFVLH